MLINTVNETWHRQASARLRGCWCRCAREHRYSTHLLCLLTQQQKPEDTAGWPTTKKRPSSELLELTTHGDTRPQHITDLQLLGFSVPSSMNMKQATNDKELAGSANHCLRKVKCGYQSLRPGQPTETVSASFCCPSLTKIDWRI